MREHVSCKDIEALPWNQRQEFYECGMLNMPTTAMSYPATSL